MSVAKKNRRKIVVHGQTFFWEVHPKNPANYDHPDCPDRPELVVLSDDKQLNFSYPLSKGDHLQFKQRMDEDGMYPPVPPTCMNPSTIQDTYWEYVFVSMFVITPRFVRELIEWCLANDCKCNSTVKSGPDLVRRQYLIDSHGGLEEEECRWAGCHENRLQGLAFCPGCYDK